MMDKNLWIVLGCLVVFGLIAVIMTKLAGLKPSGGGLIKPESETEKAVLSDELKNRSAGDAVLPSSSLISFEKADAIAKKIAQIFEDQEWFAGACPREDAKYGHVMEFRVFPGAMGLKPRQLIVLFSFGEVDGVQIRLRVMEGKRPVAFEEKVYTVADKLSQVFEDRPWVTYVGPMSSNRYPNYVCLGFDPEILQLKPDDFQYFPFISTIDGVQVCFLPLERVVAQAEGAIKEKEE